MWKLTWYLIVVSTWESSRTCHIQHNLSFNWFNTYRYLPSAGFDLENQRLTWVRQLVEKTIEQETHLSIGFINISKAFDSKDRKIMIKLLQQINCPSTIIVIIDDMHTGTTSSIRTENSMSEPFEIKTGVKQGCVLFPFLFILYMHAIVKNVIDQQNGNVNIVYRSDSNLFSNLKAVTKVKVSTMFADDCALVS